MTEESPPCTIHPDQALNEQGSCPECVRIHEEYMAEPSYADRLRQESAKYMAKLMYKDQVKGLGQQIEAILREKMSK